MGANLHYYPSTHIPTAAQPTRTNVHIWTIRAFNFYQGDNSPHHPSTTSQTLKMAFYRSSETTVSEFLSSLIFLLLLPPRFPRSGNHCILSIGCEFLAPKWLIHSSLLGIVVYHSKIELHIYIYIYQYTNRRRRYLTWLDMLVPRKNQHK